MTSWHPAADPPADGVVLDTVDAAGFGPLADEALDVYGQAMGRPPHLVVPRRAALRRHLTYPGFRARVARRGGRLVGFGYGYVGEPGQWWHDLVAVGLADRAAEWLEDCFEVVELHVRPADQGRGLGRRLLTGLLDGVERRTVVLSAFDEDSVARRLYRSVGFVDLLTAFGFPANPEAYAIMGAPLPLVDHRASPEPTDAGPAAPAPTGGVPRRHDGDT